MQLRSAIKTMIIGCGLSVMTAHAAPPEGKGPQAKNAVEQAGHSGKGNAGKKGADQGSLLRDQVSLVDAGITAAMAREYARTAGFNGYSQLPPGIRKNLMRGKPLPPGIAKKVQSGAFLERLPRHPGYEWQTAGAELILVSVVTGVIADILYDVFN